MTTPAIDDHVRIATPSGAPLGLTEVEADRRRTSHGENTIADVGAHPLRRALESSWRARSSRSSALEREALQEKTREPKPKQQGARASCDRSWQGLLETS